ncbi:retrotransposon protein, putative, ty1-copia subclass [Tanacetum coccineum]
MMNLTTLPLSFWDYALESATRIINMVPTKKGYEALMKRDTPNKLQKRSVKCIFIGYPKETIGDLNEPTNYKAAILDPKLDKWLDAMNTKMKSMKDNQVWCLVDLPPNGTVGSRWLFKKNTNMDLVAKAIAAFYNYEIWKMDVKTVFLNGFLDEDIYMVQPEGFVDPKHPRKYKVKTALAEVNYASEKMLEVTTASEYQVNAANMDQDSAHIVVASKVPMLKLGEYEIWRMRIEQYIQMIDYALWEVIENGATLPKTKIMEGVMTEIPIKTAEEKAQRRLEVKARSTLMIGIPMKHQLKFNLIKDAQSCWKQLKKRFGGNGSYKKTSRI